MLRSIFITFVLFYIVVSFSAFVYIFIPEPLVYAIQPFSLDKNIYTSTDGMIVSSYRCNNEYQPLVVHTIERYFYNVQTGQRIEGVSASGVVLVGCSWQDARVFDPFPETMPSGMYTLRGVTQAQGRFKTVQVPWQTEVFQYIAK